MRRVLGLDPGLLGAAAVVVADDGGGIVRVDQVFDLPTIGDGKGREIDVRALASWLRVHAPIHYAFIEYVSAMQEWGVGSTFRFGASFGALKATVALAEIPYDLVTPMVWKRSLGLLKKSKDSARQLAIRNYPAASDWLARKKDGHRADAILLAAFGAHRLRVEL